MPKQLVETKLAFTFGDGWDVEQYDAHHDTRAFVGFLDDRKAVDFVGCRTEGVYLIEVKDYRGRRIENKPKFNGELQRHVAAKVYDTLGGLLLARRQAPATTAWRSAVGHLTRPASAIRVVLWLEDDGLFGGRHGRGKPAASVFTKQLKGLLRWLPGHVFVVNRDFNAMALPDVTVIDLPGVGR